MKKVALSLVGVLAAAAFAPEASAVPVFARQTGMACSACHFQHFPLLNGFGRSFKASGYTMIGSQGKVEGEHLSIPATLNFGALVTAGYEKTSGAASNIFTPATGGEMQLFWGGRVGEFVGFLSELGTGGVASGSGKVLILPEVADNTRAGLAVYSIGQGASGAFEMLNTGATTIHRLMGNTGGGIHIAATSARQYVANEKIVAGGGGTGANLVVVNPDVGFLSAGKYINVGPGVAGGTATVGLPFKYVRAAAMFDLAGFDTAVGVQNWSGATQDAVLNLVRTSNKATVFDAQAQGELGGMPTGLYVSYGTSAASNAAETNEFNPGLNKMSSFNVAGELGVIPGHATVQLALRRATNGANLKDNAIMFGATYDLAQNIAVTLHHTAQSGAAWNGVAVGKNHTTLLLETLF